jgi:hypothetical protein
MKANDIHKTEKNGIGEHVHSFRVNACFPSDAELSIQILFNFTLIKICEHKYKNWTAGGMCIAVQRPHCLRAVPFTKCIMSISLLLKDIQNKT